MRNSALDARNTFATVKPFQNLHNYGGSIGGPIQKDKTFFFADFDGMRGVAAYFFSPNVPTLAMRQGDFTGMAAIRNPYTDINPISGNTILPEYLSPQALQVQKLFFPPPNFGAANLTAANYRASFNGPEVHRTEEIRLDHNFSPRHTAFARTRIARTITTFPARAPRCRPLPSAPPTISAASISGPSAMSRPAAEPR